MPLVDMVAIVADVYGAAYQLYSTLEQDSGDIKALWSRSIYRYVLLCTLSTMQEDLILTSGGKNGDFRKGKRDVCRLRGIGQRIQGF